MQDNKMAKLIKVYSTTICPYCKMAKAFLKDRGIKFEDIDISENEKAADEMIEKSGQMGIPVIEINGKLVIGFDKKKIEELLKEN